MLAGRKAVVPNASFILSPILPSKLCATSPPLRALILCLSQIYSLTPYSAHLDVIDKKLQNHHAQIETQTSNEALPLVAKSLRPVFVRAEFRLACFS